MQKNETELKFRVRPDELEWLREWAAGLGFRRTVTATPEVNRLFDFADHRLRKAGCALRIRSYGESSTLTFKGVAREESGLKIREEIESTVGDPEALATVFQRVGLEVSLDYRKSREKYLLEDGCPQPTELCIDVTSIGCFAELEGPPEKVRELFASLGLPDERIERRTYAELLGESPHGR